MEKPAVVDHPVHDLVRARWSPRAFDGTSLGEDEIGSLFEAARWAPSCFNDQPWRFVVARRDDTESFERIVSCLAEANQTWARHAGLLGIGAITERFAHNDEPNAWAEHDLGLALGHLVLQATAMGLHAHMMAGFDADRAREALGFPEGVKPHVAFAVGRQGDVSQLPETLRERESAPRSRRALDEILFTGRFGGDS